MISERIKIGEKRAKDAAEAQLKDVDYLMIYNLDHPDGSRNAKEEVQSNALISAQNRRKNSGGFLLAP